MFNKIESLEYAQEFVRKVIAKGINIKYAKLFGSYSKGSQTPDSDIDILLVANDFVGVGFIDNTLFADLLVEFDAVQVKTYSVEDYEEGDPLVDEINSTSIILNLN